MMDTDDTQQTSDDRHCQGYDIYKLPTAIGELKTHLVL